MKRLPILALNKLVITMVLMLAAGCANVYNNSKYEGVVFDTQGPIWAKSKNDSRAYYVYASGKLERICEHPEEKAVVEIDCIGTHKDTAPLYIHKLTDCEETSTGYLWILVNKKGQILDRRLILPLHNICEGCKQAYQKAAISTRVISPAYDNGHSVVSLVHLRLRLE